MKYLLLTPGFQRVLQNPFWRNTRTEKHRPDDPLNTDPPAPPPTPGRNCVCEFCGCQLTPRGEIIRMGQVAKDVRKHEDVVEGLNKKIGQLETELADTKRKLQEATTSPASSTRRVGATVE